MPVRLDAADLEHGDHEVGAAERFGQPGGHLHHRCPAADLGQLTEHAGADLGGGTSIS
jgi:hypothetical protein